MASRDVLNIVVELFANDDIHSQHFKRNKNFSGCLMRCGKEACINLVHYRRKKKKKKDNDPNNHVDHQG